MMFIKYILTVLSDSTLLTVQCILFLILNFLDGHTTWLVMKPDHYERERNPIARFVFRKLKAPGGIVFFKSLLLGGLGLFIIHWWKEALTLNIALLIGNVLYILVVRHNFKVHRNYVQHEKIMAKYLHYTVVSD